MASESPSGLKSSGVGGAGQLQLALWESDAPSWDGRHAERHCAGHQGHLITTLFPRSANFLTICSRKNQHLKVHAERSVSISARPHVCTPETPGRLISSTSSNQFAVTARSAV